GMKMIPLRSTAKGQTAFDTPERPAFVPAQLVVKVKPNVVDNVPELRGVTTSAARALRLPTAIEEPFAALRRKGLIEQVIPVFAAAPVVVPAAAGERVRAAVASVGNRQVSSQGLLDIRIPAVALTRSVREVSDEDLQGVNILRLSAKADLKQVQKD